MSAKRKLPTKLGQPMVKQSAKSFGPIHLDESKTVVSGGGHATKTKTNGISNGTAIEISSDSENASDIGEEGEEGEEEGSDAENDKDEEQPTENPTDVAMEDAAAEAADGDTEETGEPSFGDLVRAHASEPIDVNAAFEEPSAQALAYPQGSRLQPPTGASLGTVLTQALKTNDVALLESCLQISDIKTIKTTIQRLDSPLAATLLQKLAERLHRRPGRAGSLMVWVQWSMITHGGYLATQKGLIKKLAEVNRVIDERSRALQHLLSLKGKLDMLEAQIQLRRSMQNQRMDSEDNDEGVIYVEGQESDNDEEGMVNGKSNGDIEELSDSDEEDMLRFVPESDDEEEDDGGDNLIDDEAEDTDADTGDEDEVDHDDIDEQGDKDESDDAATSGPPPSKMQRLGGAYSKRR
ncbi:Small subunit (SSU) processome component [Clarireedia jacksonii]